MILAARALCHSNQQILVIKESPRCQDIPRIPASQCACSTLSHLYQQIIIAVSGGEILISIPLAACHVRRDYVGANNDPNSHIVCHSRTSKCLRQNLPALWGFQMKNRDRRKTWAGYRRQRYGVKYFSIMRFHEIRQCGRNQHIPICMPIWLLFESALAPTVRIFSQWPQKVPHCGEIATVAIPPARKRAGRAHDCSTKRFETSGAANVHYR